MSVPEAKQPPPPLDPSLTPPPASRIRYRVLGLLALMTFVLYLDRICIAQAETSIRRDLGLTKTQTGYIFAAFTLAYGLFELPAGYLGDRYGSRRVLVRIVIWWSAFTALTGMATSYIQLLIVRFLFGAGEAGALPNAARVLQRWFPVTSRGRAHGLITTAMMLGGGLAPLVTAWLIGAVGWRMSFLVLGVIGVVWATAFGIFFREIPAEHPLVNDGELALIAAGRDRADAPDAHGASAAGLSTPWRAIFTSVDFWLLGALMTCSAAVVYMLISWMPTYFKEARGLSDRAAGLNTTIVLLGGAAGCLLGGFSADWLVARLRRSAAWRLMGVSAYLVAASALMWGLRADNLAACTGCLSLCCLAVHTQVPAWWGTMTHISGRHVGVLFAMGNSLGVPAAMASQIVLGTMSDELGRQGYTGRAAWDPLLTQYGLVLLAGAVLWMLVRPDRANIDRVEPSPSEPTTGQ